MKKIVSCILLLLLAVDIAPAIGQGRPEPWSNFQLDGIAYQYFAGGAEVVYCDPELRAVSIPGEISKTKVTRIGEMAFYQNSELVTVVLPESITDIDSLAFLGCRNLSSINLPAGLTRIGQKAFQGCTSLKSISLPDCLSEMRDGVFRNCSGIDLNCVPI